MTDRNLKLVINRIDFGVIGEITNIKDDKGNILLVGDTISFRVKSTMQIDGGTVVRDVKNNKYAIYNYNNEVVYFDRIYDCEKSKNDLIKFLMFFGLTFIVIFYSKII